MRWQGVSSCLVLALLSGCSGDDAAAQGTGGSATHDASAGSTGVTDARSDRATGGGAGAAETGSTTVDARDATTNAPDSATDTSDAVSVDARDSSTPSDVMVDTAGDVKDAAAAGDARLDADAMACTRPTGPDASPDAAQLGTITNLTGYTASDVLYLTWRAQMGAVPRDRFLELRFDPSPGVCSSTLAGQRKANGSQLRIFLLRANYLMFGMLPSFFIPGTYPLNENVYELDAGLASVAEVNVVTTDGACHETFAQATAGNVTLTSVTQSHVTGTFTATFDDAGTISGGFDVDLCFDAELPECPYACVP
jgi:hypothetical protein